MISKEKLYKAMKKPLKTIKPLAIDPYPWGFQHSTADFNLSSFLSVREPGFGDGRDGL